MSARKIFLNLLLVILIANLFGKPAFAMDSIIHEKKTILPANERVDNIIVLGHDLELKGKVDVSAIVINGNLKISKSAKINGIVIVLNGNVQQEQGAFVKENILALKFTNDSVNHLLLGAALLLTNWLLRFVLSTVFVLLTVLVGFLLKKRTEHYKKMYQQQIGKVFLVGAISSFVLIAVIFLLIITIIGIPIAIILAIPPLIAFVIGLAVISQYLGEKIFLSSYTAKWIKIFAGAFLLISIFNFPFFGGIALLCVFWLSSGIAIIWLINKLSRNRRKKSD